MLDTCKTPCPQADDGNRTHDLLITNQLLYQLSYVGTFSRKTLKTRGPLLELLAAVNTFFRPSAIFFSPSPNSLCAPTVPVFRGGQSSLAALRETALLPCMLF